jgi:excisionase family DNA binding protein
MADKNRPLPDEDRQYSVREAASLLGVAYDVVLRYIRDSKLRASKVPTRGLLKEWRVSGKEIRRFQRANQLT